jgi:tRNA G18 (ribose-2'-O)-methylase SpoU
MKSTSPKMFLIITNISKANNIKSLLVTAAACGCSSVFIVGQPQLDLRVVDFLPYQEIKWLSLEEIHQTSPSTMSIFRFEKWNIFLEYAKNWNIHIVGVEIHPDAIPMDDFVPTRSLVSSEYQDVAFLMGNEGTGIHPKHMASCHAFVKIPQYGNGTASLNVNVAASIVLHTYYSKLLDV